MVSNPFSSGASVKVSAETSSFNNAIGGATDSLMGFKKQVGLAAGALGALATGALVAATNQARSFDEAIIELSKRVGEDQANEMRAGISEMAEEIPLTREEIAGLADDAARFGIEGEEAILKFTETVAKMGEATTLSTQEAGKSMAKLATLTNTPVSEIENLGSAINSLSNNFATSSQEIVDAMLRSSGALSQLGLNQQEIAGLSAAINEVSESSRRAGTRLRRVAQEMMNPKKVGDIADALGMTAAEFKTLRDENPRKALLMMAEAMAEGGEEADGLRTSLSTASRQALAGFSQNLDGMRESLEMSNKTYNEASSLQREFDREMAKTSSSIAIATSKLKGIAIEIGNNVLPVFNRLLRNVLIPAIDRFSQWNEKMDGIPATVGLVATAIGGFTVAGVALVSMLGGMSTILGVVGGAFSVLTGPIGIAALAIGALAIAWDRNLGDIRGKTQRVLGFVQVLFGKVMANLERLNNEHFTAIKREVNETLTAIWSNIIKPTLTIIQGFWDRHGDQVVRFTKAYFGTVLQVITGVMDGILTAIRVVLNLLQGDWKQAFSLIREFTRDFFRGTVDWIKTTGKTLFSSAFKIVIGVVKDVFTGLYNWLFGNSLIKDLFNNIAGWLRTSGRGIMSSAFGAVTSEITDAFESAKSRVSGLIGSMISAAKSAASKASNIGSGNNTTRDRNTQGRGRIIPKLDSGGFIEDAGLAMLHSGERVVPAAQVTNGGSGTTVNIDSINASGKAEGRAAGRAIRNELKSQGF